jgi:hypothetical protein
MAGSALRKHSRVGGQTQTAVYDYAQRVAAFDKPYGQSRIIGQRSPYANHYRIVSASELMRELERRRAADPLRVARDGRNAAIERLRQFYCDKRQSRLRMLDAASIFRSHLANRNQFTFRERPVASG